MENRSVSNLKGTRSSIVWTLAIATVVFVGSCSRQQRPQDGILSRDEMVRALIEIYIAEEKVNRLTLEKDSAERLFGLMEAKVYEKTGIPDSVFRKSFDYYYDRPKQMEEIYTAVVDSLQLREQRAPERNTVQ